MGLSWSSSEDPRTEYAVERRLANITIAVTASPETVKSSIDTLVLRQSKIEALLDDALKLHEPEQDEGTSLQQDTDFVQDLKSRIVSLQSDILALRRMKLEAEAAEIISGRRDEPQSNHSKVKEPHQNPHNQPCAKPRRIAALRKSCI